MSLNGNLKYEYLQYWMLPTWNCKYCDMPMKTQDPSKNMNCPNCGKSMVKISYGD